MKRYVRSQSSITSAVFGNDLPKDMQDQIRDMLSSYGFSNAEISEILSDQVKNIVGNPESPINIYVAWIQWEYGDAESGPSISEGWDLVVAESEQAAKQQIESMYYDDEDYLGVKIMPATTADIQEFIQMSNERPPWDE